MTAPGQVLLAPAMRGEYLKTHFEVQNAPAEAIAERTGTGVEGDMYPQIPAGAVTAASQVAVRRWYGADLPLPLPYRIELALRQLASACSSNPVPAGCYDHDSKPSQMPLWPVVTMVFTNRRNRRRPCR